jgi:hypothetical protein
MSGSEKHYRGTQELLKITHIFRFDRNTLAKKALKNFFSTLHDITDRIVQFFRKLTVVKTMCAAKIWPRQFTARLQKLRNEKLFTDVDIVVEGKTFSAHRNILCAASEYFFRMFTGNMVESSQNTITLSAISSPMFQIVLDFIYGTVSDSEMIEKMESEVCSVEDVLHASDMLQLDSLKEVVTTHMLKNISSENMLAVYFLGWKYNSPAVCEKTLKAISKAIPSLVKRNEFTRMSFECLKALFGNPRLQSDENDHFKAIMQWFNHDMENREHYFDEVMNLYCCHSLDFRLQYGKVAKLHEARGKKRSFDEACGENPRCPWNVPDYATTLEELRTLYGDRYINLNENIHLMNTFTRKYSDAGRIPAEMMKIKISEKRKLNRYQRCYENRYQNGLQQFGGFETESSMITTCGKPITIAEQVTHGDHHTTTFHQDVHNADHAVLITGNYWYKNCGESSLGIFSRLARVRLIAGSPLNEEVRIGSIPNPRYTHPFNPALDEKMWRYPYMLVIGGPEVDMDDAVRFACSLVTKYSGDCDICKTGFKGSTRFIDIWSSGLEKERAQHFGWK